MRMTLHLPVMTLAALALTSPAQATVTARAGGAPGSLLVRNAVRGSDLRDLGRATAATRVGIVLMLRYRNQAELDQLVRLQNDRRSPLYHRFLQPAQFAAEFSPTPADYRRVALALGAAGFEVEPGDPNRTLISANAAAPVAERFFGTEIHRLAQTGYGVRYANVTAATLPAALASTVRSFAGVDDVVRIRTHHLPAVNDAGLPDPAASSQVTDASPDLSGPIERKSSGSFAGLYPTGIAKAYRFPTQSGYTGAGSPIGIVIDSDIKNSDLTAFWTAAKITRTGGFYRVDVSGKDPGVTADVGETAIDTEMASSLAPGADIYLYLIPSLNDAPIEKAYNKAVASGALGLVSSSFGGCETSDTAFADATNAIAEQGAAVGETFTASTGDSGGFCDDGSKEEPDVVNAPASDPYFVAVGGTTLKINASNGARTSETAWGPGGANGGGGGGVSDLWPVADYQSAIGGIAVNPVDGFAGRNVPDLSLDGSNKTGSYVAIYERGAWTGYGGTSVSNPMFAAFLADENQENGADSGWIDQYLYEYFGTYGYSAFFHDITSGSIGAGWKAAPGYDQATGIGSINGATGQI